MVRSELDNNGVWTLPGGRTKNHRTHALALPPLALKIIGSVPVIAGEAGLVFTLDGKHSVSGFSKAKLQLDAAMTKIAGRSMPEFRLHDLRRSCASGLAALGVQLPVAVFAVPSVIGRHPKTFTIADITSLDHLVGATD